MKNKNIHDMRLHEIIHVDSTEETKDGTTITCDNIEILKVEGGWIYNNKVFVPSEWNVQSN